MSIKRKSSKTVAAILAAALIIGNLQAVPPILQAAEEGKLVSQGKNTYASTVNGWNVSKRAVDGDLNSGWESIWQSDEEWIYVDLGVTTTITDVKLYWDRGAYAKDFKLQISSDELVWEDIHTETNATLNDEGVFQVKINPTKQGRYIRLYCTKRSAQNYGYNLKEFKVYGTGGQHTVEEVIGENIALNKPAEASSIEEGSHITQGSIDPGKVTDGNMDTRWSSDYDDKNTANKANQWIYVDLGESVTIGRVILHWEAAYGRAYDIQVSDDASNWTTVYRQLTGAGNTEKIPLYASGRYVRMYGHAKGSGYGYSMYEFEVYPYVDGQPKPEYEIKPLPEKNVVQVGAGSYLEDIALMQPREPVYKTDNITGPIPSNKWWTSLLVNKWGNSLVTLPGKAQYDENGLALLYAGEGVPTGDGGAVNANGEYDFHVNAGNLNPAKMNALVNDYSDYGVEVILTDDDTPKMVTNFVKGSPYFYFEFSDGNSAEIYSTNISKLYDSNGNTILTQNGDSFTADHIGMEIENHTETNETVIRNFGIYVPEGTVFRKVGSKIKMQLGSGENYMSIGVLQSAGELEYLYQHAYAFVKDTVTEYEVRSSESKVVTNIKSVVELKRQGFSSDTLMCLLPHQWKKLAEGTQLTDKIYDSIRGDMKVMEGNEFVTVDNYNGIIPQFTEPENSEYSRDDMVTYLRWLEEEMDNNYWVDDPYWQGKVLHPVATAILITDQMGETQLKDKFVSILREVMANWLTYSGEEDAPYYMYYSPTWGALNGDGGDHGMAINLSDHHYLWGYFTYAAGVLGTYDESFVRDYGGMVDLLIRDVGSPDRNDDMFPYLRNFDPYEGHSWAGGYADNNNGANQEAAAECLFAWIGEYLWGTVTGNDAYADAAIYLYTTESYANMQYWFNYDGDNFPEGYQYGSVGMLYGSSINFGTYFSGAPENIYGIHWLPTSPHITIYGIQPEKADNLYKRFLQDLEKKEGRNTEIGWYHIIWPFQSLGNPTEALSKWDADAINRDGSKTEVFNTYLFMNSMVSAGTRNGDLYCSNWTGYSVFKKGSEYTAMIWNPTNETITAEFKSYETGEVTGTIQVPAKSTVSGNPFSNGSGITEPDEPGDAEEIMIEAENYTAMEGVAAEPCNDVDGGSNLGWIDDNDWMEYTLTVPKAGTYRGDFRVKGWNDQAELELVLDGNVLTAVGAHTQDQWKTITSSEFNLPKGTVTLRVQVKKGGFNFNWMKLIPVNN